MDNHKGKYPTVLGGCRQVWKAWNRKTLELLVIKQIGLPLRGRPILLITRITKDRIGLH